MNILLISLLVSSVWFILWVLWVTLFFTRTAALKMSDKQAAFVVALGGPFMIVVSFLYFLYGKLGDK